MDSGADARWPALISDEYTVELFAFGGTGYVRTRDDDPPGEDTNFVTHAREVDPDSDIVLMIGSVNDYLADPVEIEAAAEEAIGLAQAAAQGARIVVIGPISPTWPVPDGYANANTAVGLAAAAMDVEFFDAIDAGWFEGHEDLIGEDTLHPTDAGHAYLAELIRDVLAS